MPHSFLRGWVLLAGSVSLASVVFCANTTAGSKAVQFNAQQRSYWAFQKVTRPAVPAVPDAAWSRNPIDAFIWSKLEAKGLHPSTRADRAALLRRVTFDLTGLPPTPEEVDAFAADQSPDAYNKVVDRLLASPRYGERWARHWLDLARYAESEGFKSDETRPNAWRYRDYVIQSFNENKPYNRFVQEQLAGDELWPDNPQARVATAFLRHYPDESNARNLFQRRQEILDDITDTTASVFMGMTYGCARCHNHKYDPILQTDYYRLQAFFANTAADDNVLMLSSAQAAEYRRKLANWEEQTKDVRAKISQLLAKRRDAMYHEYFDKYPPEIQAMITKPAAERTPYDWQMFHKAEPYLAFDDESVAKGLKGDERKQYDVLKAELDQFASLHPGTAPAGTGMMDLGKQAPPTFLLAGGNYSNPQQEVRPGFLTIIDPAEADAKPTPQGSTGRRTALAQWLTRPDNPLTARVMVNRIWHYHFGTGIVATPSDFGLMGQRPSHPELLDWLTSEFVASGWDMKRMHRLIVTSETYQQSPAYQEASAKVDPRNKLLWRFPRTRLEGEEIRDAALSVAGVLNTQMGGPSVMPELPAGMAPPRGGWQVAKDPAERNRRSVYIFVRRNARYPMLEAFDMPDTHESCGRRNMTLTAPQALSLLNGKVTIDWAQAFAARVLAAAGAEESKQIETAYRLAFSRRPTGVEKDTVQTFFQKQRQILAERVAAGEPIAAPEQLPQSVDRLHAAALVDFCHTLINSNEFVYSN